MRVEVRKARGDIQGVGLYAKAAMQPGDVALKARALAYEILSPRDQMLRGAEDVTARCSRCGCDDCDKGASPSPLPASLRLALRIQEHTRDLLEPDIIDTAAREAAELVDVDATALVKLRRNGHAICDDELREVGIGLFERTATAANHSCRPNIWARFRLRRCSPPVLEYVVVRAVSAGDELRHEYGDDLASYGFRCDCGSCDADRVAAAARRAADDAIRARDFFAAAAALSDNAPVAPPAHPLVGLHHLKLAKLLLAINEPHDAKRHLAIAIPSLRVSHGPASRLVALARDLTLQIDDAASSSDDDDTY